MTQDLERHSKPLHSEPLPDLTEAQKAHQEALNTLYQYDRMEDLINGSLASNERFRLRPHIIQELNGIAMDRLEKDAGRWRDKEMAITNSSHKPPSVADVPRLIDELCDYVNDHWENRSALHLAAYVMWWLNWIHPFTDGNGRTTRAVSYYVLCSKLGKRGFRIHGVTTIPELIANDKTPYYKALETADNAYDNGRIDVSEMEGLLKDLLARQVVEHAESNNPINGRRGGYEMTPARNEARPQKSKEAQQPVKWLLGISAACGLLALVFFMYLVIRGEEVPTAREWLVVIVLALSGAFAFGSLLGGSASVRGSIPIEGAKEHPVRFVLFGGIAVLVPLLILGKALFL